VAEALGGGRFVLGTRGSGIGTRDSGIGTRGSGIGTRGSGLGAGDSGIGARDRQLAYAVADKGRTWVFIDGRTYVIDGDERDERPRPGATEDRVALSAPMPATVVKISVAPGQEVNEGDLLIMLEAMKMEMPIKAPRSGRVTSLACKEGELVQAGVPLLELD
jgi:acetyl-CoA/propionyl-CoA carboxylase, biotin carboxylase, biotin carboxyl carrier protein